MPDFICLKNHEDTLTGVHHMTRVTQSFFLLRVVHFTGDVALEYFGGLAILTN